MRGGFGVGGEAVFYLFPGRGDSEFIYAKLPQWIVSMQILK